MPPRTKAPDYQRRFDQSDFRGYFCWTKELSDQLGGSLYHACHEAELRKILAAGEVRLRSEWQLRLPEHGTCTIPGVWMGLNYYHRGNHFGPCLFTFPIGVLNGRNFMVFRRIGDHRRYFFVQYESKIPIYSFEERKGDDESDTIKTKWRTVAPDGYFAKGRNGSLSMKEGAIYCIVLTAPLPLTEYKVDGVEHTHCISGKCTGSARRLSHRVVRKVALAHAQIVVKNSPEIQALLDRFPCLVNQQISLEHPDD